MDSWKYRAKFCLYYQIILKRGDRICGTLTFLDGNYSVNELGEVRSNERYGFDNRKINSKIIKPYEINSGYLVVDLRHNGQTKRFLVHRLVYCTIYNIDININMVVHHKDHN